MSQVRSSPAVRDKAGTGGTRLTPWLVGLLAFWLALDVGGRFFPPGWLHVLHVLPEHAATRRPPRHAPFIPNLTLHYDPWVGETATTGNLKPSETRPAITFSTDSLGFRATPGVAPSDHEQFLLTSGASFAYGGGLSDDEAFPAVLSRTPGMETYNGGRFFWDIQTMNELDWLLAHLGNSHPTVIALCWEQFDLARSQLDGLRWKTDGIGQRILGARYWEAREDVQSARRAVSAFWFLSPLEVLSIRAFKKLSNDRILPNPYKAAVETRTLEGGREMMFLKDEVDRVLHPPSDALVTRYGDYFSHYRDLLRARGCDLYVILLPNKYTLYGPPADGEPYLNRLDAELSRRDVKVLNGLAVLKPHVGGDIASGDFSYYREDHHWTPLGVRRIAAAFEARVKEDRHAVQ